MKRIAATVVIGVLLLGQAAPLMATGRHCPMQARGSSRCGMCDSAPTKGHAAALAASSCCRFEAANPTSQTPGIVSAARRAGGPTLALDSGFLDRVGRKPIFWMPHACSARARLRSTDSPLTLRTTLRL